MEDQTKFEAYVDNFLEEEQKNLQEQESIIQETQAAMAGASDTTGMVSKQEENRALLADIPEEVINQLSAAAS